MDFAGSARRMVHSIMSLISGQRPTERVVAGLTKAELLSLVSDGTLPYKDRRVAALIWELKYYANPRAVVIARTILCDQVASVCEESLGVPLLITVPTDPRHIRTRGHDHTALLGAAVAESLGPMVDYARAALWRVHDAVPQQSLGKKARLRNVRNTMQASAMVSGRTCIVLDDVKTTGATCQEAARALIAAGALKVVALTVART